MQQTVILNFHKFFKAYKVFEWFPVVKKAALFSQPDPKIIYMFNASQLSSFKASNLIEYLFASRLGKILSQ